MYIHRSALKIFLNIHEIKYLYIYLFTLLNRSVYLLLEGTVCHNLNLRCNNLYAHPTYAFLTN